MNKIDKKKTKKFLLLITFCSTPNCKSALSFSDTAGKSTGRPGKLTPFLLPSLPPFSISHFNSFAPVIYTHYFLSFKNEQYLNKCTDFSNNQ